ncbi:MAG: head GIN domain-containing protein [Ferruginibacter sp.]
MKKIFLSVVAFFSVVAAIAQENTYIADANAEKRTLSAHFAGIEVSDGVDLYITKGNDESIAVSASEEKYLERFKTIVENGVLKIYYDNKGINWAFNEKRKLKAWVSFTTLERIVASGGAGVKVSGSLKLDHLDMKFTSGASFAGKLVVASLSINQNSGSNISISGVATSVKIDISSGAIFKGFDFVVDYCEAKASSGGGIRITVNKELNAKANSGGGIRYKGEAVIKDMNVNSGGLVKKA